MKSLFLSLTPVAAIVLALPAAGIPAAEEVQQLNGEALAAMEAGKWEDALALFDRCIAAHGQDALARFGPSFGVTWYRKGMCEMRLRRWDAAMTSFETCYRDFSNPNGDRGNRFHKQALLRWGESAQAAGKPAEAIRLFRKFLEERDKKHDDFEPGSYYIQLALCHFQLGEIADGTENLETAVRNRARFGSPESGLIAALKAFVDASIAKKDEASLVTFLSGNRAAMALEPFQMEPFAAAFVRLGTEAMEAGMDAAALALFEFGPTTDTMIADLRIRIAGASATDKVVLETSLTRLETLKRDGGTHDEALLSATAVIHERQGDPKKSFAAYEQLELQFSKSPRREENLHNLVRTASLAGEASAATYGNRFLEAFPGSPHVPAVRQAMLTALYDRGDYAGAIAAASALLPKLTEGTREHDGCLRVLGASHHHAGDFAAAQPLLDRHATLYPESPFRQESLYLQAANLARLQRWADAVPLLDKVEGPFLAAALLERARCHAAVGENAAAIDKLNRLEKEFPDSEVIDAAILLKGELAHAEGRRVDAKACYKTALSLAEKHGNRELAAEVLHRLIVLASPGKQALSYIDRFWKDHGDTSPWRNRVAIAQAAALDAAGREKEALERLQPVIAGANPAEMQEAVGIYAALYLKHHGAAGLKEQIRAFPGIPPENKSARAWLQLAAISAFENQDHAAKAAMEEEIKGIFQELKSDFTAADLPAPVLIRLADYLAAKTSAPRQALPFYDEAIARKDSSVRFPALLGRATVLTGGNKEEAAAALRDLQVVLADSPNVKEREDALFWIIATEIKAGQFEAAGGNADRYLSQGTGFTRYVPEVRLARARSLQERGVMGEAVAAFKELWSDPACAFQVAAPAMKAWLQLSWDRPVTSPQDKIDRRTIHGEGAGFLERTRPLFDRMNATDQEAWLDLEKLVQGYQMVLGAMPPGQ